MNDQQLVAVVETAVSICRELDDDFVGLWVVPRRLRRAAPDIAEAEVPVLSEVIIRGLLKSNVRIGDLSGETGEFTAWDPTTSVERVMQEWRELGRDPTIGDIAWLSRQP